MGFCKLLVVVVVAASSLAPSASLQRRKRIINGEDAKDGEFPSHVSLRYRGNHHCGASILSSQWVLTGAQCVAAFVASDFSLVAGTNSLNHGGSVHQLEEIIVHENFSFYTAVDDIALLKVSPKFTLDSTRQKIKLPLQGQSTRINSKATVIGWGATGKNNSRSNSLQKVDIRIVDHKKCEAAYKDYYYHVHDNQICAGSPSGDKGDCYNDFGGPLFVDGVVVGLSSWSEDCMKPEKPSVFTRVSSYRSWIQKHIGV